MAILLNQFNFFSVVFFCYATKSQNCSQLSKKRIKLSTLKNKETNKKESLLVLFYAQTAEKQAFEKTQVTQDTL